MGMIQPKALLPGGKIGIVALAGPLEVETVFKGELIKRAYPKNSIYDSYLLVYERIIDLNDARVY